MPIPGTHFSSLQRKKRVLFDAPPTGPRLGNFYFDNLNNRWAVYDTDQFGKAQWYYAALTTTTSTSTSTTSTSTSSSTTSTSSSSSTSTSTSTSSSTSTTTTL